MLITSFFARKKKKEAIFFFSFKFSSASISQYAGLNAILALISVSTAGTVKATQVCHNIQDQFGVRSNGIIIPNITH